MFFFFHNPDLVKFETLEVVDAVKTLMELKKSSDYADRTMYVLAWMVGARLVQDSHINIGSLNNRNEWEAVHPIIGPICADVIWGRGSESPSVDQSGLSLAIRVIERLISKVPHFSLLIADALWQLPMTRDSDLSIMAPEVCDLLFSMLQAPKGAKVWIPFDPVGQLAVRATMLGLDAESIGPEVWTSDSRRLCRAAVLGILDETELRKKYVSRYPDGKIKFEIDYLIAVPPIAIKVQEERDWHEWEGFDDLVKGNGALVQKTDPMLRLRLDRADSWAPAAFWPRVRHRAVFMAGQSLLFTRGQEQSLREFWVRERYPMTMVVSLPMIQSFTPASILVFDRGVPQDGPLMADFRDFTLSGDGRAAPRRLELERCLSSIGVPNVFLSGEIRKSTSREIPINIFDSPDKDFVRQVSFKEIASRDFNLQPSRYLKSPLKLSGNRRALSELVEVIRAPTPADDKYTIEAIEIGVPDLGVWRPIVPQMPSHENRVRVVKLRERRREDFSLKEGDIVISIKGAVGRAALVGASSVSAVKEGADTQFLPLVTSGNCVALRLVSKRITPEFLLMYIRSEEFSYQTNALLVGSSITHVTPSALCESVLVPIPSSAELLRLFEKYKQLCELESLIESTNQQIKSIVQELWPLPPASE